MGVIGAFPLQISLIVLGVRSVRRARSRWDQPRNSRYSMTVSPGCGTASNSMSCCSLSMGILNCEELDRCDRLPPFAFVGSVNGLLVFDRLQMPAIRLLHVHRKRSFVRAAKFVAPLWARPRRPKDRQVLGRFQRRDSQQQLLAHVCAVLPSTSSFAF